MSTITILEYNSNRPLNVNTFDVDTGATKLVDIVPSEQQAAEPGCYFYSLQSGLLIARVQGAADYWRLAIAAANAAPTVSTGTFAPPLGIAGALATAILAGAMLFERLGNHVKVSGAALVTWTAPGVGSIVIPLPTPATGSFSGLSTTTPDPLSAPDPEPSGVGPFLSGPNAQIDLASSVGGPQRVAFTFTYEG